MDTTGPKHRDGQEERELVKLRVLALLFSFVAAGVCVPASTFAVSAGPAPGETADSTSAVATAPVLTTAPPPANTAVSDPDYHIVVDDVLRLDVWGEQTLSGAQMAVTPNGSISVPFLGEITVLGMTQAEVSKIIATKLQEAEILADAKVQISLVQMHRPQARILGAVQRPCSFEFKDGDTILDAIGQGGSYAEDAMLESASVTRKDSDQPLPINLKKLFAGDLSQNYKLQNGDAIYVPHEDYHNKFYVFGQVYKPGQYSLKDNTDVLTAISLAGGQLPRASIRRTIIVRATGGKPEKVNADLNRLFGRGDMSQNVTLKAGDIVIVPETKSPDLNKIGQAIGAVFNAVYLRKLL